VSTRSEEEQLALIQEWWQRNGKPLLIGGVLALAGVFGWQYWQKHQLAQSEAAAGLYQRLLEATLPPSGEPDAAQLAALAGELQKDYKNTAYAQYASLFVAKVAVDTGKLDEAAAQLQLVLDRPYDETLGELARQRLARVLTAQGKAEEGLALLTAKAAPVSFAAAREELVGDLLVKLGRSEEAHAAYSKAKAALSEEAARGTLQMKLDDLAKGDA
jgi:predicted negative regulator of RcsB-dependent stress response